MKPPSPLPERRPFPSVSPDARLESESPLAADERAYEELEAEEQKEGFLEQHQEDAPVSVVTSSAQQDDQNASSTPVSSQKDEVTLQIEKILEESLGEYVATMPEDARIRFLYKGQETASRIAVMVRTMKVQAKKVVELIRDWLLSIPGVNKFFLEQEAKIKTDRVLELEREYKERKP